MLLRFSREPTLMYKWIAYCAAVYWCTTHSPRQCST